MYLNYPFAKVKDTFQGIVFGNLEGPITRHPVKPFADKNEIYYFQSPRGTEKMLANAGFAIMSLANNHIKDCGIKGMEESARLLKEAGITPVGTAANRRLALRPVILTNNGLTIGWLAFDLIDPVSVWATQSRPGAASGGRDLLVSAVKIAKTKADIVVVSLHWLKEVIYD